MHVLGRSSRKKQQLRICGSAVLLDLNALFWALRLLGPVFELPVQNQGKMREFAARTGRTGCTAHDRSAHHQLCLLVDWTAFNSPVISTASTRSESQAVDRRLQDLNVVLLACPRGLGGGVRHNPQRNRAAEGSWKACRCQVCISRPHHGICITSTTDQSKCMKRPSRSRTSECELATICISFALPPSAQFAFSLMPATSSLSYFLAQHG